jgi:hypothetical protein
MELKRTAGVQSMVDRPSIRIGGDFELSVPLETLGMAPRKGMEVLGDVSLLRGDHRQTIERIYWNNLDTLLVSDLFSEAAIRPDHWGLSRFD